jgi:hypothetical protein
MQKNWNLDRFKALIFVKKPVGYILDRIFVKDLGHYNFPKNVNQILAVAP